MNAIARIATRSYVSISSVLDTHAQVSKVPGLRSRICAAAFAIAAIAVAPAAAFGQTPEPYYIAVNLAPPSGYTSVQPQAVNADGTVIVGQVHVGTKNVPFIWRNGQMNTIGNIATMTSGVARSVNGTADSYRVVGEYSVSGLKHGFVYSSDGTFQDLPMIPGHEQSTAWSINADGKIAGYTYFDTGQVLASVKKQAVPVRWDPISAAPGVSYSQPVLLYNGPLLSTTDNCQYSGRGFGMANPIRINDATVPAVVTSMSAPTTNCLTLGTTINIANYTALRAVKHVAGDDDVGVSSWKLPPAPGTFISWAYAPNSNFGQYNNYYGWAINNIGTEIHNDVAPYFAPGISGTKTTAYTWTDINGVSASTAATGPFISCSNTFTLRYADVNDHNEIIGFRYAGATSPCSPIVDGFVKTLGGSTRSLIQRVNSTCSWTRLTPVDINNEGAIVGTGIRAGAAGAFLLIPVATMPASADACSAPPEEDPTNRPPVANAGIDQEHEATSPLGATATLNGSASSDPDGDSLEYSWTGSIAVGTGPSFTITLPIGIHDFRLTVEDPSGESDSDTVRITVKDTTPPDTFITMHPAALSVTTQASFAFAGSDVATDAADLVFQCSLDSSTWSQCTSPKAYSGLSDGNHTFAVRAVDTAGLVDPTPATFTWAQDATPPDTFITGHPPVLTTATQASFTFTGSDDATSAANLHFECRFDTGAWSLCASPRQYSGLADGNHAFAVRAVDAGGLVDPTPATYSWAQDSTPPDTVITAHPPALSAATQSSFSFTGSDEGTSAADLLFECRIDAGTWLPCTSPRLYSSLNDGDHAFAVRALDAGGLVDPTPATYSWEQDSTPPTISLNTPAQSASYTLGAIVNANYSCADSGSGVATCTGTLANGTVIDTNTVGSYSFQVDAADLAGNQASKTRNYTVSYGVCNYTVRAGSRAGSVIPLRLEVCGANGVNLSSPDLVVSATGVIQTSTSTSAPLAAPGNSSPDFNFRYSPDAFGGGYKFNLQTTTFAVGTFQLLFKIGNDPVTHTVEFQITH